MFKRRLKGRRGSSDRSKRGGIERQGSDGGSSVCESHGGSSADSSSLPSKSCLKQAAEPIEDEFSPEFSESETTVCFSVLQEKECRKEVSFRSVHVREFERVIGDNPSCSSGAPIAYVRTAFYVFFFQ
jgi:hypothetical protein